MIFAAVTLAAFPSAQAAELARQPSRDASYWSAVNWEFPRLDKLDAWRNTSVVIQKSLAQWYPPATSGNSIENGTPATMRAFLARLAKADAASCGVIYLASHQTREGLWQFREGEQSWPSLLGGNQARARPARFVIIDACFAEAAPGEALCRATGATGILYSALRAEVANEVTFHRRFPIDLTRRHPAEAKWLREALGAKWDGRVSFLGFIWLRAFLATPTAPRSAAEWHAFFRRCETLAADFRQGRGEQLATTVRFIPSPTATR